MDYDDGLAVWDAIRSTGVIAVGIETYANSRRMEKSLRLQNADLTTEYNLFEADLARPKVKEADFCGKARHVEYRQRAHQPAMLCTLVMTDNVDSQGRRTLSGGDPARDGPGDRRDARRCARPQVLHDLDRLSARRSAGTSRSPICRGTMRRRGESSGSVFWRRLPRGGGGRGLHRRFTTRRTSSREAEGHAPPSSLRGALATKQSIRRRALRRQDCFAALAMTDPESDILHETEGVVDRRVRVARRDGVADPEQLERLRPGSARRIVVGRRSAGRVTFPRGSSRPASARSRARRAGSFRG